MHRQPPDTFQKLDASHIAEVTKRVFPAAPGIATELLEN